MADWPFADTYRPIKSLNQKKNGNHLVEKSKVSLLQLATRIGSSSGAKESEKDWSKWNECLKLSLQLGHSGCSECSLERDSRQEDKKKVNKCRQAALLIGRCWLPVCCTSKMAPIMAIIGQREWEVLMVYRLSSWLLLPPLKPCARAAFVYRRCSRRAAAD